jgi:hypothetical protein
MREQIDEDEHVGWVEVGTATKPDPLFTAPCHFSITVILAASNDSSPFSMTG